MKMAGVPPDPTYVVGLGIYTPGPVRLDVSVAKHSLLGCSQEATLDHLPSDSFLAISGSGIQLQEMRKYRAS